MKTVIVALVTFAAAILLGCGAGRPNLKSISVSPTTASAALSGIVVFTATGDFTNNSSRALTAADGLSWSISNNAIATITDNTGSATCVAPGSITVTATAPRNVSNTATNVTASATLNCS